MPMVVGWLAANVAIYLIRGKKALLRLLLLRRATQTRTITPAWIVLLSDLSNEEESSSNDFWIKLSWGESHKIVIKRGKYEFMWHDDGDCNKVDWWNVIFPDRAATLMNCIAKLDETFRYFDIQFVSVNFDKVIKFDNTAPINSNSKFLRTARDIDWKWNSIHSLTFCHNTAVKPVAFVIVSALPKMGFLTIAMTS